MKQRLIFTVILSSLCMSIQAQYIHEVLEYKPAPGQLINTAPWGIPHSAETLEGTNMGTMTLGAFGGYVVFRFENPVENDPNNPYGVDFTIFGNPTETFSEAGIVSVMKDENNNGLADDTWYELAGSEYFFSTTNRNYSVTYTNPGGTESQDIPWTDSNDESGFVLANSFHPQNYYPLIDSFPAVPADEYTLFGTKLYDGVNDDNASNVLSDPKAFGYADNTIIGDINSDLPDNPYTAEVENIGGDSFDISWAVNEDGEYVNLDQVDFIKVHNAVQANAGWLGEISTEIRGALDIQPATEQNGSTDRIIIKPLPDTITGIYYALEVFAFVDFRYDPNAELVWNLSLNGASVDDEQLLTFTQSGELDITVSLADNPEIHCTASTYLKYDETHSSNQYELTNVSVYPNPVKNILTIEGESKTSVSIYSLTGQILFHDTIESQTHNISVENLNSGIYILKVRNNNGEYISRFQKL